MILLEHVVCASSFPPGEDNNVIMPVPLNYVSCFLDSGGRKRLCNHKPGPFMWL